MICFDLTDQVTVSGWGLLSDGGKAAKKLQEVDLEVKPLPLPHQFPLVLTLSLSLDFEVKSLPLSFCFDSLSLSDYLDERVQRGLPLQEKLDIFKDDVHFQVG